MKKTGILIRQKFGKDIPEATGPQTGRRTEAPVLPSSSLALSANNLGMGGSPMEVPSAALEAASILNRPILWALKNFLGMSEKSWAYKVLTAGVAPLWETQVFQRAGMGIAALGMASGNMGLVAVGLGWATVVFAFAHVLMEWIARIKSVGWGKAFNKENRDKDAALFGRLVVASILFISPIFSCLLLPQPL